MMFSFSDIYELHKNLGEQLNLKSAQGLWLLIKNTTESEKDKAQWQKLFSRWTEEFEKKGIGFLEDEYSLSALDGFSISQKKFFKKMNVYERAILMTLAAEKNQIQLQFAKIGESLAIKSNLKKGQLYSLLSGKAIKPQELAKLLSKKPKVMDLSIKDLFYFYLLDLKKLLTQKRKSPQNLLVVYQLLLSIKGADLELLIEKIKVLRQLGLNQEALLDFKRFLAHYPEKHLPENIKKLYLQIQNSLKTQKTNDAIH